MNRVASALATLLLIVLGNPAGLSAHPTTTRWSGTIKVERTGFPFCGTQNSCSWDAGTDFTISPSEPQSGVVSLADATYTLHDSVKIVSTCSDAAGHPIQYTDSGSKQWSGTASLEFREIGNQLTVSVARFLQGPPDFSMLAAYSGDCAPAVTSPGYTFGEQPDDPMFTVTIDGDSASGSTVVAGDTGWPGVSLTVQYQLSANGPTKSGSLCRTPAMTLTFAVYTPGMGAPKTNGCWAWDRPGDGAQSGWTSCGAFSNSKHEPYQPLHPSNKRWFVDDVTENSTAAELQQIVQACARAAGASSPGYLYTAFRKSKCGGCSPRWLTPSAQNAARSAGTSSFFFQIYDNTPGEFGCPPLQSNCATPPYHCPSGAACESMHPIYTPELLAYWQAHLAHLGVVAMLDGTWASDKVLKIAVTDICQRSLRLGLKHVSVWFGSGGVASGKTLAEPVSGTRLAAIDSAMDSCTASRG